MANSYNMSDAFNDLNSMWEEAGKSKKVKATNKSLKEGIEENKVSVVIDWADDELDTFASEADVVNSIKRADCPNEVEVYIKQLTGSNGWPEVELSGDKQLIRQFLTDHGYDVEAFPELAESLNESRPQKLFDGREPDYDYAYSHLDKFVHDEPGSFGKFYRIRNSGDMEKFLDSMVDVGEFKHSAGKNANVRDFAKYIIDNHLNEEKKCCTEGKCDKKLTEAEDEEVDIELDAEEVEEEQPEVEASTVEEFIKELKEYDGKLSFEFGPVVIGDQEYQINGIEFDDSEDGKLIASIMIAEPEVAEEEIPEAAEDEVEVEEITEE